MRSAAPLGVPAHVPLVHVLRDGLAESVHHGSVVVLAPDGSTLFQAGDVSSTACYPRSAAKPMQAVAMVRLGLSLPPELLALTAASHSGEQFHLVGAQRVLDLGGFTEADLGNPADLPFDPVERAEWVASGRAARKLAHNCSGKHASMLHTARQRGWSTSDYLDPEHPLQREIAATVQDLTGERVAQVAVDGCRAPLFAVSLRGLAAAAGRIAAAPGGSAENVVAQAIRAHPEMVAGTRRDTTELMTAVPGLIAKDGFEAVQVAALPGGTAIAIKIADGGDRARLPATIAALALAGVEPDLLAPFVDPSRTVVGELTQRRVNSRFSLAANGRRTACAP
ncbi:asparaginase [Saccharopolyspora sp. K220]|uniref:asparaginase n=1 Tax=Saccharopolyspora soli TaxID=2926618 RepID=UPI001F58786A|nr:asparaginase [Saccharopolyspora soli]MCI2416095.1 asparaginase [Saccharopolyspora soli]